MTISSLERERRLYDAVEKLSKYYGLRSNRDDINAISQNIIRGIDARTTTSTSERSRIEYSISEILLSLFNSPGGANLAETIATTINNQFNNSTGTGTGDTTTSTTTQFAIGNVIQIIGDGEQVVRLRQTLPTRDTTIAGNIPTYNNEIKRVSIFSSENNSVPMIRLTDDERIAIRNKNMSIIMVTSPNLNISTRNTKAVSQFLNGVPPIEFSKAVPYLEVQFELPIPALDSEGRLLSPSIYKFMLGGVDAEDPSPLWSMQSAFSSSNQGESRNYTTLGMEAFTSPQLIYNRRYAGDANDIRANQVLDPTRPILSINSFGTSEVPSFAMNGYRSATLRMTLHDRSRMPDVAPFFRADLRGNTRVKIEYGWHHPEGEDLVRPRRENVNPYVDLINGMRRVEKFQIRNSSFSFRENGAVEISLDLVTLGQSQLASELIVRNPGSVLSTAVNEIERLQTRLSERLARTGLLNESSGDRPSVEIRGTEVLHAASDAFASGFYLNTDARRQLNELLTSLEGGPASRRAFRAPELQSIRDDLVAIWGDTRSGRTPASRRSTEEASTAGRVRTAIATDIASQVNEIRQYCLGRPSDDGTGGWGDSVPTDPLVVPTRQDIPPNGLRGLLGVNGLSIEPTEDRNRTRPEYLRSGGAYGDGLQQYTASLATIMAYFVGKPLLATGAYEEVQLLFYPFNENAAYARYINIGNFEINLGQLTEMLISYRMSNLSRSATMTLVEFWNFINTNFIDNPAASSYGLWDNQGNGFFRPPTSRERRTELAGDGNPDRYVSEPSSDEYSQNFRISSLLGHITPTHEFHPPQLRMFTECMPVRNSAVGDSRNILKIHIYDQQSNALAGAGEILMAERNRALSLEARPEASSEGGTVTSQQWQNWRNDLINRAVEAGILEQIEGSPNSNNLYIRGGSRAIKDFLMQNMPHLIPGTQYSLIKTVNLNSLQDEAAATLNLVNSPRTPEIIAPNGEEPGNLPLQVIPLEMSITTQGCPLLSFASQFFVDLNTGTTADDIYAVNNISSEMEPGSYKTTVKLRPISGYTRYRNYLNEIRRTIETIDRTITESGETPPTPPASTPGDGSGSGTR